MTGTKVPFFFLRAFQSTKFLLSESMESSEADIIERFVDDENRIFTMEHLGPAFRLLFIGLGVSGIAFVGELICYLLPAINNKCLKQKWSLYWDEK